MPDDDFAVEMKVENLVLDPLNNSPIIILKEMDGTHRTLPIWVGFPEATAIALEIEHKEPPRPMTHDLIKNLLDTLDVGISHITISDLRDSTFFAIISLKVNTDIIEVDSRPSDAIAVALRFGCPIFVAEKVLQNAHTVEQAPKVPEDETDVKKWIDSIKPSDFGKIDQ